MPATKKAATAAPPAIRLFGVGDQRTRDLKANLQKALAAYPVADAVEEVTEFNRIYASGVSLTPALMFGEHIMTQGRVPSVEEIESLLRQRFLAVSKLNRLVRIGVAMDFSEHSENAFRFAWQIAAAVGARLECLFAFGGFTDGIEPTHTGSFENLRDLYEKNLRERAVFLSDQMEKKHDRVLRATSRVLDGEPEIALAEHSEKLDLLVMATEGRSDFFRKTFSTISIETAQKAHAPVLLVPPTAKWDGLADIAYAANFESLDGLTIRQMVAFSKKFGSKLHFVHIGHEKMVLETLDQRFFKIHYLDAEPGKTFHYEVLDGSKNDLADRLDDYSKKHKMSLVAVVTEQRSMLDRWLHGPSQTKNLALKLASPMLVMHLDHDQA